MSDTGPLPFPPHGPGASDAAKSAQDPPADSVSPPPRRLAPVLLGCLLAIVAGGTGGALLRLVREPEPAQQPLRSFRRRPGNPVAPLPVVELPIGTDPADIAPANDLPLPAPDPSPGAGPHLAAPSSPGRIATARVVLPRPPRAPHPTVQPSAAALAIPEPGQPARPASIGPKSGPLADVAARTSPATATASELLASARSNLAQDRLENAVDLGRQALAAGAGLDAHLVIGSALMKARRPREAEPEFEAALSLDPGSALAIRRLQQARERIAAEAQAPPAPPASTSPPAVDKNF